MVNGNYFLYQSLWYEGMKVIFKTKSQDDYFSLRTFSNLFIFLCNISRPYHVIQR